MFYKNKAVERVLQEDYQTRGNDKLLILKVWEMLGLGLSDNQRKLMLSDRLPSAETIRRTRQKLQQEGKYLPSLTKINERKTMADNTKQALGEDIQARMFDENVGRKMRRIVW